MKLQNHKKFADITYKRGANFTKLKSSANFYTQNYAINGPEMENALIVKNVANIFTQKYATTQEMEINAIELIVNIITWRAESLPGKISCHSNHNEKV